jgi:hypothetical protein
MHSFSKLEILLNSKGLIPRTIFTMDDYIVYIEVFNVHNAEYFFLYIPSKYNIKPDKGNVYKIKYVDIEDSNNIVTKYTGEPDGSEIKNDYDAVELESSENLDNLEQSLNDNYNKEILLKDINKYDKDILKEIFRQLNRFKFCVQNIKYKLAIVYKNYLCAIKRDDVIECYYIKNFPVKSSRKLYTSIDLKSFYEKIENVPNDIKTVKDNIYKILNQNHIKHSKMLNNMLENKDNLLSYSEMIYKKKEYFTNYISDLEKLLAKLNDNEQKLLEEKNNISNKTSDYGIKGVHGDIQNSHMAFNIDTKLGKVMELKQELVNDIVKTRTDQENMNLEIDKILFDNSVMLNEIIKNFNSIKQIIE